MAEIPKTGITGEIINVEPDPRHPGRTIVSARFDDGDEVRGPWVQAFSIENPERPLTPEEFVLMLREKEPVRPIDPFKYIKEHKGKKFTIHPET
jgi:hypothetical protein